MLTVTLFCNISAV